MTQTFRTTTSQVTVAVKAARQPRPVLGAQTPVTADQVDAPLGSLIERMPGGDFITLPDGTRHQLWLRGWGGWDEHQRLMEQLIALHAEPVR